MRENDRDPLDPDGLWRAPDLWDDTDCKPLSMMNSLERTDLLLHVSEWTYANPYAFIRQGGALLRCGVSAHLAGEPIGRALGLEPPAGLIARQQIMLTSRNTLLRRARASVPAWRDAATGDAAAAMTVAFDRYVSGSWCADRTRETAPAGSRAFWWRILRLGLTCPMPGPRQLCKILDTAV